MTAQISEKLIYKGIEYDLFTLPLENYFKRIGFKPKFALTNTSRLRGYICTWQIIDNKLNLIAIKAYKDSPDQIGVDYIFPGQERMFADWFTGELKIPLGKILKHVHMGFGSISEKTLYLEFKNGFLINERIEKTNLSDFDKCLSSWDK
jgi:hypothetical protein